jgi:hypothetical protein
MTITIQRTSKPIKLIIFIGQLVCVIGLVMAFSGNEETAVNGMVSIFFGAIIWAVGLILKWWRHG